MTYAVKLPQQFRGLTVIQYTEPNGTITFDVLPKQSVPGPQVRRGEKLESLGQEAGTVFTFTDVHHETPTR